VLRLLSVATAVFGFMLVEARRAAANERAQRARGGVEPARDVYRLMRIVYPAAFLSMLVEGAIRPAQPSRAFIAGVLLFALAKGLKWWAIVTLGPFWTFRVIVVRRATLVAHGPYRWLSHPNYVAVIGELGAVALMAGAPLSGLAGIAAFAWLLWRRISVESEALLEAR